MILHGTLNIDYAVFKKTNKPLYALRILKEIWLACR